MADIKIVVGVNQSLSYSEMRTGLNAIRDRLNSNPIKIKVTVDQSKSVSAMRSGVKDVVKTLNSNPPELKVKFNKSSLTAMKKQFAAVTKFGESMSDKKASGILKEMTKDIKDNTNAKKENAKVNSNNKVLVKDSKQYFDYLNKANTLLLKVEKNAKKFTSAKRGDSKTSYNNMVGQIEALKKFIDDLDSETLTKEKLSERFSEIKGIVDKSVGEIRKAGEDTTSFFDRIGNASKRFASWFTASQVITQLVMYSKQMVGEAIKVESAMAQIQIVTGASDKQMQSFLQSSIALAKELGQSITDVASSIETFTRLGYNMSDSSFLAKYANIMSNVAKTDIGTSTTGITSIIKGYDMAPEDAEHVADVLTKVGQEYAISAEELMAAFQRGGAALHASGTDFEKSAALFAATNASLQNAETTGVLWKTRFFKLSLYTEMCA